jgi:hypothetical protein
MMLLLLMAGARIKMLRARERHKDRQRNVCEAIMQLVEFLPLCVMRRKNFILAVAEMSKHHTQNKYKHTQKHDNNINIIVWYSRVEDGKKEIWRGRSTTSDVKSKSSAKYASYEDN